MQVTHQLDSFATSVSAAISPVPHGDGLWIADASFEPLLRRAFELQQTAAAAAHATDVVALGLQAKQLLGSERVAVLTFQLFSLVVALLGEAEAEHQFERANLTEQRVLGQSRAATRPAPSGGPSVLDLRLGRKP